jgi:hypothetical protein
LPAITILFTGKELRYDNMIDGHPNPKDTNVFLTPDSKRAILSPTLSTITTSLVLRIIESTVS